MGSILSSLFGSPHVNAIPISNIDFSNGAGGNIGPDSSSASIFPGNNIRYSYSSMNTHWTNFGSKEYAMSYNYSNSNVTSYALLNLFIDMVVWFLIRTSPLWYRLLMTAICMYIGSFANEGFSNANSLLTWMWGYSIAWRVIAGGMIAIVVKWVKSLFKGFSLFFHATGWTIQFNFVHHMKHRMGGSEKWEQWKETWGFKRAHNDHHHHHDDSNGVGEDLIVNDKLLRSKKRKHRSGASSSSISLESTRQIRDNKKRTV